MNDFIKKGFYLGLGAGAMLKENLEKAMNEAAEKGESMTGDTKDIAKDIVEEISQQIDGIAAKGEAAFDDQMGEAGIATKKDVQALMDRVTKLELKLAALEAKLNG